jgi:hypothetical protein
MRFLLLILLYSIFFTACKPSGKSAAQYNNSIVRYQSRIGTLQMELFTVYASGNVEEMRQLLDKFRYELRAVSDSIALLPPFDGKDDFKKSALVYIDQLKVVLDSECVSVLKLYQLPDTSYHPEEEQKVQGMIKSINDKTSKALDDLKIQQQKFAAEYNFEISEN